MATVQEALAAGLAHHQAGRLADAEAIYRDILAVEPRHAEALHLLGVLAHQIGQNEAAIALYRSLGFVEEGRWTRRLRLPNGDYLDDVCMALST